MANKPKLKKYSIGFVAKVWVDVPVKAESMVAALGLAESLPWNQIAKVIGNSCCNDCSHKVIQVYDPDFSTEV